ncbi:MAG: phage portal protein [Proteobacteria bacterium]|nr:phage portal protein [Pseudomonadota bacterium]
MKQFVKKLMEGRAKEADLQKASQAGTMIACQSVGRPVWTPRRYDQLSQEGYHKNVIAYRAVNLISRGVASVPWRLYEGSDELSLHPLLDLLHAPSPSQAGAAFMESVTAYLLLAGNAYVEAVRFDNGEVAELHTLRPDRVKVIPNADGTPAGYEYTVNGQSRILKDVLHLKFFNPLNDWYGMSPLEAAAQAIDQHNTVAGHNLALLQNGGRPSGALIVGGDPHDMPLTEEQRVDLKNTLQSLYEGHQNAGRVMVLEGEFRWQEMGLSPRDLDFIEGKKLSAREIAQAYGVPPMLAGVPGDATFSNYKEARYHLWEDTVLPLLDHLIDEFNRWLCPAFGEHLRLGYHLDAIPALATRREEVWTKFASATFLTINEKRKAMGYPPIEGGDTL